MKLAAWIDALGERIEHSGWLGWLTWEKFGDPASWVQHTLVSAASAFVGGLFGALIHDVALGILLGAVVAWGYYLFVREKPWKGRDGHEGPALEYRVTRPQPGTYRIHTGWLGDKVGDLVGTHLVLVLAVLHYCGKL